LAEAVRGNKLTPIKQITAEQVVDHGGVVTGTTGAFVIVQTNEGRYGKMLVQLARQRISEKVSVPMLLIERYTTYKEGTEQAIQANGLSVSVYVDFRFSLDLGQVVPQSLGGDVVVTETTASNGAKTIVAEPVGKAKFYLLTKALPEALPKKGGKLVVGDTFEVRYFNGEYRLFDDGRRSGLLKLSVDDAGDVTGSFVSDRDGQKYDVKGKVGVPKHSIEFTIQYPRTEQTFRGCLFTGDAKALAGTSKLQEREAAFYATRVED
jgi:hypothetical protein